MTGTPMCHQHMHLPAVKHSSGALYTHGTVMHCRSAWKIGAFPNLGARQSSGPFQTTGSSFRRKAKVRVTAAQSQDEGLIALPKQFYLGFASTLGITKDITRTQAYSVWLQGGVVLVILAAIDAAFSGDWSRIGILSKDAELGLRPLLGLLGLFHIACGSVTALDAAQKGYNPVPQTLKVLAVGFLATVEQLHKDPAE